jgi:hypothetical protein
MALTTDAAVSAGSIERIIELDGFESGHSIDF